MEKEKLKIDFDAKAKLEIKYKVWLKTEPDVFRSWPGERRLNGKTYNGPIYIVDENKIINPQIMIIPE